MGFPQKMLADDEQLVLVLRKHASVLVAPLVVLAAAVAAVVALVTWVLPDTGAGAAWARAAVALVAIAVVVRWTVLPFLRWRTTVHAVTSRRLVMRRGILGQTGTDVPLTRIDDVAFHRTLGDRLLGRGTLEIATAGERGPVVLDGIPKVELVQRTLVRLADDLREPGVRPERDALDPGLARDLDAAFDDEYRGPADPAER